MMVQIITMSTSHPLPSPSIDIDEVADYDTVHDCIVNYDCDAYMKLSSRVTATMDDMKTAMKLYIKSHMFGKEEQCELENLEYIINHIIKTSFPHLIALTQIESDWMCHICYEYMRYLKNPDEVFIATTDEQFDVMGDDELIANLKHYAKTEC
jgi:hypothetical protein